MTGAELRSAREALGLSVSLFAERLEVDQSAVRRWESGDRAIPGPVRVLVRLWLRERSR
ncbi:DNA-binding transcriptional regulator YiaG [Methylorubrum rhodinum]|uniref:DNA-binding transcriptional regulator YiaG n=1 Tax=Methylorubrum rhodinum TaxID=29428 RepID=A0A840ZMM5_9HYPH|nr:helix-turn-helix domain-containing protein [Methylorubrum rhodinum]MBB5758846.1 DNA-binding transcriptional regulator YiaG [Methylorubrum rhodinum]